MLLEPKLKLLWLQITRFVFSVGILHLRLAEAAVWGRIIVQVFLDISPQGFGGLSVFLVFQDDALEQMCSISSQADDQQGMCKPNKQYVCGRSNT